MIFGATGQPALLTCLDVVLVHQACGSAGPRQIVAYRVLGVTGIDRIPIGTYESPERPGCGDTSLAARELANR